MDGSEPSLSLWLVPEASSSGTLRAWIEGLAQRFGGPAFAPHVTLLSRLRNEGLALAATEAFAACSPKVQCVTESVDGTQAFFRNLYLPVEPRRLIDPLHVRAAELARQPAEAAFLPHLSLFYGSLQKEQRELCATEIAGHLPMTIELAAVELWSVRGPVEGWARRARILLGT